MTTEINKSYSSYYQKQNNEKVYPTEFVVRALLGKYPNLKIERSEFADKAILDLGFGDGRNMPLLSDLGFKIHGVEITEEICDHITKRMGKMGINIEARVGSNSKIPYGDAAFDHILACNSCYYIDLEKKYSDNLAEIARVIKPNGMFIHSLPMGSTFIMDEAENTGDNHMRITQDPYGCRVGAILRKFDSVEEIESALEPWFTDIRIGSCQDNYWGSKVHLWFVVCRRK